MIARWKIVGAALLLAALAGCGGGRGSVSGTVKFNGQPLKGGTITFYDQKNQPTSTEIKEDGSYSVPRVPAGPVKVAVAAPLAVTFDAPALTGGVGASTRGNAPVLPAKYQDPEKSGLGFDVTRGSQTRHFDLPP